MIETIITASILIIIVLILRQIFKKAVSRRVIYALWAIVALRLLMPFSLFESRVSIMNVVPQPETVFSSNAEVNIIDDLPPSSTAINNAPTPDIFSFINLRFIWLTGSLLTALCFIYSNIKFTVKLHKSRKRFDSVPIPVYISDIVPSPCLYGIFKPCIYITPQSLDNHDFIIKHELSHFYQRDNWVALIRCVCVCIHWFNPLVWLASSISQNDGELSCDERTIKAIGEENRTLYGKLLIDMAANSSSNVLCLATSFSWDKNQLSHRIKNIAKKPKNIIIAFLLLIALSTIAIMLTFGSAKPTDITSTPNNSLPSEERLATAQGFLKNVFTAPHEGFAKSDDGDTSVSLQQAISDICGEYVDKEKQLKGGSILSAIRNIHVAQTSNNRTLKFNNAEITGEGDSLDYIANITIIVESGIETETTFSGILQFTQDDKINFFTVQQIKAPYISSQLNEIIQSYTEATYTIPTLVAFQPSVHLLSGETSLNNKRTEISLTGDSTTIDKYKKPTNDSSGENYYYQLEQSAIAFLKLCPQFDKVVIMLNNRIEYDFTRKWAQDTLGDDWNTPIDTLQQLEQWFELAKSATDIK